MCAPALPPPLWQRQMDWEPPYLPGEAVYGSSSGESRRSLKISFEVTAINLSRGVRMEPAPELVCQGRRANPKKNRCQRLRGSKPEKVMSLARWACKQKSHSVSQWKLEHFWDFIISNEKELGPFPPTFAKIRVWLHINALLQYRKWDYCHSFLRQQRFVKHGTLYIFLYLSSFFD